MMVEEFSIADYLLKKSRVFGQQRNLVHGNNNYYRQVRVHGKGPPWCQAITVGEHD